MLSRKSKDKTSKSGLAGKYIKKDTSNPEIKRKNFFAAQQRYRMNLFFFLLVINVWTSEQTNSKPKNRQLTPFEDQPSTSKAKISGPGMILDRDYSQGKFTPNPSSAHVFGNLHINDQPSVHQSSVESMRRISTQSLASFHLQNHQNSHGNYVEIDAIDTILSENDNFLQFTPQYERNASENRMQSIMDVAISSPIYENSVMNRSESPIYSNTCDGVRFCS